MKKNIYLPNKHQDIIKKTYKNLGLNRNFINLTEKKHLKKKISRIKIKILKIANTAKIEILKSGFDIIPIIKKYLRDLCLKHIDVIYLHISLETPEIIYLVNEFEKMNFFFSGIIPNEIIGDSLILQYLNNIEIKAENIHLHSDFAKKILNYIFKEIKY